METPIDFGVFVSRFDAILARGLSAGLGDRDGQMCIEAAVCAALDLPHGDNPPCVSPAVRAFKIILNDANWSTPAARANGLRALGIAQVGSVGVISDSEFSRLLVLRTGQRLLPELRKQGKEDLATQYESASDLSEMAAAMMEAAAARAGAAASRSAVLVAAEEAAMVAASAVWKSSDPDYYLRLSADIALSVLRDLGAPGIAFIGKV